MPPDNWRNNMIIQALLASPVAALAVLFICLVARDFR